jgi:hypothetical protein
MSGVKPTAVTGARCRIKVGGKVVAFGTGLSYSVQVEHAPVTVIGAFEVVANEPVGYTVNGQLQIVRYTKAPNKDSVGPTGDGSNASEVSGMSNALNPGNLLMSETFDIEVSDKRDGTLTASGIQFVTLRNCRLTARQGQISARQLATETLSFTAIFFDDDEMTTSPSGVQV